MQRLSDDAWKVGDLRKQLSAKVAEMASAKEVLKAKEATLKVKDRYCDKLSSELGSARAAISRGERPIHDFAKRVCTGYNSLIYKQAGSS